MKGIDRIERLSFDKTYNKVRNDIKSLIEQANSLNLRLGQLLDYMCPIHNDAHPKTASIITKIFTLRWYLR